MKTTLRYYRVDRRRISFVKFILEAYDNMAVMTTLDPYQAVVKIAIAPGCEKVVDDIINSVAGESEMVIIDEQELTAAAPVKDNLPDAGGGSPDMRGKLGTIILK